MIKPIQILNDLISTTEHKVLISNVITNADGSFTLYVNYTYYLNSQRSVIIDGITYRIRSFNLNESITVTGSVIPTATEFTIEPPTFKHGTPKKVDGEIANTNTKSYPFIWLLEFLDIEYNDRFEDTETVTPDLNLFFLTDTYYQNWDIDQHYTEAIHPMLNEIDFFIRTIKKRRDLFGELESHTITNHVNFGEYITNKGYDQLILNGHLSGCQLKIALPYVVDVCNTLPVVSICNPVSIYENDIFKEYVQAGGSFYYNSTGGGDATQIIEDSASNILYTNVIPSGDTETQIITDATVTNSDASYNANILAQGNLVLPDITNTDSDGTPIVTPAQTPFVCTPATPQSGIAYKRTNYTGMRSSYATNDDYWRLQNGFYDDTNPTNPTHTATLDVGSAYPFFFLLENNAFGNKARFTDSNGNYYTNPFDNTSGTSGTMYANNYLIDHLTGYGWSTVLISPTAWDTLILTFIPSYSNAGYSDYYMPSMQEVLSIANYDTSTMGLGYYPFNQTGNRNLWTSTTNTYNGNGLYYQQIVNLIPVNINTTGKSGALNCYLFRKHY